MKKKYEVNFDVELINTPEVQELIKNRTFSSTICDLLSEWISTGSIKDNAILSGLKEQLRVQNQLIEHLTAVCEKSYRAADFAANAAYENYSAEACNRIIDATKKDYINLISGTDDDETFLRAKPRVDHYTIDDTVNDIYPRDVPEDVLRRRREMSSRIAAQTNFESEKNVNQNREEDTKKNFKEFFQNSKDSPKESKNFGNEKILSEQSKNSASTPIRVNLEDVLNLPDTSSNE